MPDTKFAVTRFANRNGAISWRVSGWLKAAPMEEDVRRLPFDAQHPAGTLVAAISGFPGRPSPARA